MTTPIAIVDPADPASWPATVPPGTRRHLAALVDPGPAALMANAGEMRGELLRVGDAVLPVLISGAQGPRASILSPLAHHVLYPAEEIARASKRIGRGTLRALLAPLVLALRLGRIDRCAFVNHWLLSGAPDPGLPAADWAAALAFLAARHPDHALVVQDVTQTLTPELHDALAQAGGEPVPSRRICVLDPSAPLSGRKRRKLRNNRNTLARLLAEAAPRQLGRAALEGQEERLAALHAEANIGRHSQLNPAYTAAFFRLALACEDVRLAAWAAPDGPPGEIAAFNLQREDGRRLYWTTFGRLPPGADDAVRGYELAAASDIAVAAERGLLLDWGGGAEHFKRMRGAVLHQQLEMVFTRHLPWHRRAAWGLLARLRRLRARQVGLAPRGRDWPDAPDAAGAPDTGG
ncbi:hypothetical protein LNKW23_11670 [Paralimibaculum aggregatum]|uniref:GNAT family N-acetyltransferase n=1 Tax=Paralimibaculum aggregatum TaxID=3036245 RepID=A0ABQ6LII5_9RHOB|nr:GNAT family N-acetyltransferase [Limibaculum sp. NKW23]GMG81954.1 hypothetical protein LNKW23_11670 [Limibaculum sp. NKW23]